MGPSGVHTVVVVALFMTGLNLIKGYDPDVCENKAEPGKCGKSLTKWAYNCELNDCEQFTYTGCGGNLNRYESKGHCLSDCKKESAGCISDKLMGRSTGKKKKGQKSESGSSSSSSEEKNL